jgi:hypothetical protein
VRQPWFVRGPVAAALILACMAGGARVGRAQPPAAPASAPGAVVAPGCVPPPAAPTRLELGLEGGLAIYEDPQRFLGAEPTVPIIPFRWDQVDSAPAFAVRGTAGFWASTLDRIDLRGTWYGEASGRNRDQGQFFFQPGGGVSPLQTATLVDEMSMWGVELNWTRALGEARDGQCARWRLGGGLRYLRFSETAGVENWTPGLGFAGTPFIRSEARNSLVAGQVVAQVTQSLGDRLSARLDLAGIFGSNTREVDLTDEAILSGGRHTSSLQTSGFTWGIEATARLSYALSSRVSLSVSYTILLLDEISRANLAMDFNQANTGAVQAGRVTDNMATQLVMLGVHVRF